MKDSKIGVVFSGGGGRGYFHLGVGKAFSESGIRPDIVCGTSAGSVAGVLVAAELDIREVEDDFPKQPLYNWHNISLGLKGFAELNTLRKFLKRVVPYDRLEDLPIPFIPVSTNLHTGEITTPTEGYITDWVLASCAIPVIVEPVKIEDSFYVDGGLLSNLPASVIREKCDFLIGVNLFPQVNWMKSKKLTIRDVGQRSLELYLHTNAEQDVELCDVIITNKSLGDYNPHDYSKKKELIQMGYETAKEVLKKGLEKAVPT